MKSRQLALLAAFVAALPTFAQAFADDDASSSSSGSSLLSDVQTHAFLSQSFIKSTEYNYLTQSSLLGSFEWTEGGINFTKQLSDNLRTGLQLFASDLGTGGSFNAQLDWFYLDYRWRDWLGLRVGRVKIPFGLYNDTQDVDSGRTPILLPQSVYPVLNRNYLLAQTGMELYGYSTIGGAGALDYRAYLGTIFLDLDGFNVPGSIGQIQRLNVPYVAGGRLLWETPLSGLRAGVTVQALRLDLTESLTLPTVVSGVAVLTPPTLLSAQAPVFLWVASLEYTHDDLLLAAEYSQWNSSTTSSNQALVAESTNVSQRAYAMGSYRVNSWLQPALYYSVTIPAIGVTTGAANQQHDISATLRFDINRNWLVKLEGHYMIGTAGVDSTINGNVSQLPDQWCAFLVRTTAYF